MATRPSFEDVGIQAAADELAEGTPLDILSWAVSRFAPRLALATAFGAEGCVLVDLIGRHRLPIEVLTVDTGLFFPETLGLWQRLEERYGIRIRAVRPDESVEAQAASHGHRLWERSADRCCELRKVIPLQRELSRLGAWVTAIRRDQTPARADARVVEADRRFGLLKVNPLVAWTSADVWAYVRANDVPVSSLHELGYPSVGCIPCTSRVLEGEEPRAGRWRGVAKTECGLHARPEGAAGPRS